MMQPEQTINTDVSSIIEASSAIWHPGEYDETGRVTRELKGDYIVRETLYNDDPNGNWLARWSYYDLSRERTQIARPDLLQWIDQVRKRPVIDGKA